MLDFQPEYNSDRCADKNTKYPILTFERGVMRFRKMSRPLESYLKLLHVT